MKNSTQSRQEAKAQSPAPVTGLEKYNPAEIQAAAPASWAQVEYWAGLSAKLQQGSVAAQVMCGFVLVDLHEKNGIKAGARTDLKPANLTNDSSGVAATSWAELVKRHAGVSHDTARNWMGMAASVRRSWRKLEPQVRLRELMRVSPADWSKEDTKLIGDAVNKATDGVSQVEFMREIGAAKKPVGNTNSNKPGKKPNAPLPPEDVSDPLLEIENDILSISDDKDLTIGDCNTVRLAKFKANLEKCLRRVDAILKARKK